MHKNNNKHNIEILHHILDPDSQYHTMNDTKQLHAFFKNTIIPDNTRIIACIYFKYQISSFPYEQYPFLYPKLSAPIQKRLEKHLQFDKHNFYYDQHNLFFIVMVDIDEDTLLHQLYNIQHSLSKKTFVLRQDVCHIQIKCGIYFSHIYIDPYEFYRCAKEQFYNTLHHSKVSLSFKNDSFDDEFYVHAVYKNKK